MSEINSWDWAYPQSLADSLVLADRFRQPGLGHVQLYHQWAQGGVGLQVTGNVMVDRRALGEPRNVV